MRKHADAVEAGSLERRSSCELSLRASTPGRAFRRDDTAHASEPSAPARLAACAASGRGGAEELCGVLAAACRAAGLAARTVHALVPSPLKPTEHLLEMSAGFGADPSQWCDSAFQPNYVCCSHFCKQSTMVVGTSVHLCSASKTEVQTCQI